MASRSRSDHEALRHELRAWLREHLPAGWSEQEFVPLKPTMEEQAAFQRWWHRTLYEGGWAGANWPTEYGGRGLTPDEYRVYGEEMARAKAPEPLGLMGLTMVGPTLMMFGNEEQKQRFLPKMLSGEEIWCQGYSEPNSGSDLASLRTSGVLDGDEFVINGQKTWTTQAFVADWMFILVRTDPKAPKHRGISYLLMDMKSPGVTLRPLVQITGEAHFAETFLDNVRVPRSNVVGELNRGWYVGVATLAHERGVYADTMPVRQMLAAVVNLAKRTPRNGRTAWDDPLIRRQLIDFKIKIEALQAVAETVHDVQRRGAAPAAEANICKLWASVIRQGLTRLGHQIPRAQGILERGSAHAADDGQWVYRYLLERSRSIRGGTDEIQLNIIAERGLGLPR